MLKIDQSLEAEFALRQRHPERDEIYDGHRRRGAALRARGNCRLDVRYGAGQDVFDALVRKVDRIDASYQD